ncbi:MAG: GDP-mannose 4,6-dehydratase [Desulfobacterales bacterium]|nr:GDP-mannose 4,6-dehydratase [Desulfobacterales bacterium]
MKKVLVTGAEGFTGKYVTAEMKAHGWKVWRTDAQEKPGSPEYRCVDLCHLESLCRIIDEIRPDTVIHLAAISFVGHGDANAFYRINLIGARNLLSALAACSHRPECVLLASSANIYGNAAEGVLDETTPPNPANDYAVSKLAMEFMARLWMDRLPVVLVRPFNYTGVGQAESFLLAKIAGHFRRRADVIELGNLDVWRDFSDVRAVARAYRRLVEVCPAGETVNICSGRTHSLREALSMAETIAGHRMRVEVSPALVRANEVTTLSGDPTRLRRLIGSWDTPALEETLRWMLEENAGPGGSYPSI